VVICVEQGTDLHMAQLMPLPLTVSCFSKIQIGYTFLVPAHLGSPRQRPLNARARACVRACVRVYYSIQLHKPIKKVKFSHTRYRALGPELIPVYSQQPAGDVK